MPEAEGTERACGVCEMARALATRAVVSRELDCPKRALFVAEFGAEKRELASPRRALPGALGQYAEEGATSSTRGSFFASSAG